MRKRQMILPQVFLTCVQSNKFKTGSMSFSMLQPLERGTAGANALVPSVLLRGCQGHPDMASISGFLDEQYGATFGTIVRKKGEVQAVGFYLDFLEEQYTLDGQSILTPMVDFLGDVLLRPVLEQGAFVERFVEGEKQNLLNAIDSRINNKRGYATLQMLQAMCAQEAYGVPRFGLRDEVEAITATGLYQRYLKMLTHSQIEIFYVGTVEPSTVAELLKQALGALPRGEIVPVGTQVCHGVEQVKTIRQSMDVTQGNLCMGLRLGCTANDPGYAAALVMNSVFGAGVTSKLFENVREKMSLCYYASSSLEKFKGMMVISSGIAFDKFEIAKNEILKQLDDCAKGDFDDHALDSAKSYLLSSLKTGMDSPGRLDDYALGQVILGREGTMADFALEIAQVTHDQVAQAAAKVVLDTVYFLEGDSHGEV